MPAATEKSKAKKVVVKLPMESAVLEDSEDSEKIICSLWSRRPLPHTDAPAMGAIKPPDTTSMEINTIEQTNMLPAIIDVFLPGKVIYLSSQTVYIYC